MDWEEPLSSLTEGSTACSGLPVPQQDILFISQRVILPHHFVACSIQSPRSAHSSATTLRHTACV